MFLIFVMNRPDVFPAGDLGVRAALRERHGLAELPAPRDCHPLAEAWRPYRTIASWYIWRGSTREPAAEEARVQRARIPVNESASIEREKAFMFDLILRGGWVIDGSGGPPFRADVALLETMIADVGRLEGAQAPQGRRCRGPLHRSRVHRRTRPRRPHASGRPDSPSGFTAGSDDLSHRPGRQLVCAGVCGDARLHEALHGRLQRQPRWPFLRLADDRGVPRLLRPAGRDQRGLPDS